MGCSQGKQSKYSVEVEYRNKALPLPDASEYENDFEKEMFMTICLLRLDPKIFIPQIKVVKSISFFTLH